MSRPPAREGVAAADTVTRPDLATPPVDALSVVKERVERLLSGFLQDRRRELALYQVR